MSKIFSIDDALIRAPPIMGFLLHIECPARFPPKSDVQFSFPFHIVSLNNITLVHNEFIRHFFVLCVYLSFVVFARFRVQQKQCIQDGCHAYNKRC
jgi:hypothetical protein